MKVSRWVYAHLFSYRLCQMSTYDPFGWSSTLAAARSTVDASKTKNPGLKVMLPWLVMRLVLGVVVSILFELVGAFVLSQTDYSGYDFRTHKRARAIIAIGGFGELLLAQAEISLTNSRDRRPGNWLGSACDRSCAEPGEGVRRCQGQRRSKTDGSVSDQSMCSSHSSLAR